MSKPAFVYGPVCAPLRVCMCVGCLRVCASGEEWRALRLAPGRRVYRPGGRTRALLLSDGAQTVPESHSRSRGPPGHFFSDFHILLLQVSSVDEFCKSYLGRSTSIMELQVHTKFHF